MDGGTVAYPFSKSRLFLISCIGLMLPVTVWASVHFALAGRWTDAAVLGAVSIPLLVIDVWVWRRLLTTLPAILLTPDALFERASLFGAGRVERGSIADVRVERQGAWTMVVLDFHEPKRGIRKCASMIPAVLLGESPDTLAQEIREWAARGTR